MICGDFSLVVKDKVNVNSEKKLSFVIYIYIYIRSLSDQYMENFQKSDSIPVDRENLMEIFSRW